MIKKAQATLPTKYGIFQIIIYASDDNLEHVALVLGDPKNKSILTRIHSQCLTGDTFSSLRCDCGPQLKKSMEIIGAKKEGVILYLNQEGRGIGLTNKIRAYALQDKGADTVEANEQLDFPADARNYDIAAEMLCDLGCYNIELLTNNPQKAKALALSGVTIHKIIPLEIAPNEFNKKYLETKKKKMGHLLKDV